MHLSKGRSRKLKASSHTVFEKCTNSANYMSNTDKPRDSRLCRQDFESGKNKAFVVQMRLDKEHQDVWPIILQMYKTFPSII